MSEQYVIIGNSIAAAGCIEGIRSVDPDGSITVVTDETHPVYSRPLISYLLQKKTDLTRMKYRPDDFYEKNKCAILYGIKATQIDVQAKAAVLSNGTSLPYTRLLAATGSSPFVPPMPGLETVEKHFSFQSLDDALALQQALCAPARVLIIGCGLIGLKCAEGILEQVQALGGSVTAVDLAPRILSSILDDDGAAMVQRHLEKKGLSFRLGASVKSFCGSRAELSTGENLDFDVLVTAVGVRPNTALVRDAGGACRRGITVDERMHTTLPDVYAAGDCAEIQDSVLGQQRVLAILPLAYRGGYAAGVNMAGGEKKLNDAFPMNAIGFFGLHILTAGIYEGEVFEQRDEGGLKRLFYRDDRLSGFILIGDKTKNAGIYTALLRERTPLSAVNFPLLCHSPSLAAFSRTRRDEILAGKLSAKGCELHVE